MCIFKSSVTECESVGVVCGGCSVGPSMFWEVRFGMDSGVDMTHIKYSSIFFIFRNGSLAVNSITEELEGCQCKLLTLLESLFTCIHLAGTFIQSEIESNPSIELNSWELKALLKDSTVDLWISCKSVT